ncbi:Suf-domain-containing protein [Sporormia fimetaria CBS 119925]|uniref:mRNA 3'-end-processing protein RNA14 n=1 Tax=Sporormia fimetaria CBS 119925 TaxID=1340428 RepID=A0A6A6VAD2_9PLEO|nr:Suf-domain-containing protein [Sporormia fimetaria CBS 119925]
MDSELAFLEAQKESDPAGDYTPAAPVEDDDAEYDPEALIPQPAESMPSSRSASMAQSATGTPAPTEAGQLKPQPAPAATTSKQPRKLGGFVVESEDEDEAPESKPEAGAAMLSTNGMSGSPQRSLTHSPNNTLPPSNTTVHNAQDMGQSGVSHFTSVAVNDTPSVQPPAAAGQGSLLPSATNTSGPGQLSTASARSSTVPATPIPTAAPSTRLPQDRVGILEDRIAEDPRGDIEAWLTLVDELRKRHKIDEVRSLYDRFFKVFPTAAEQWNDFVNMELGLDELNRVERLFERSITTNPNVNLWSTYINYIRRIHNMNEDAEKARPVITQVYEFVLENIGIDVASGRIWLDYIEFLKSGLPGVLGGTNWQDMQKMDTLRKVYQRAIAVPTNATMEIWREYDRFELHLNKATGRKHLQEQSPFYMTARSANNVLENITKGISRSTLPKLPPVQGFEGYEEYMTQVKLWKHWLQWEKDDPLMIKEDRRQLYNQRVIYLYKQALMPLRFWPELWYEAAEWCFQNELEKEGNEFLAQGIEANPESCLLAFKQAHQIELRGDFDDGDAGAVRKGEAVRAPFTRLLDELYELTNKLKKREELAITRTRDAFANQSAEDTARGDGPQNDDEDQDEEAEKQKRQKEKDEALQNQIKGISAGFNAQILTLKKLISHAWIALMRSMRRIQGKGSPGGSPPGFRGIFAESRKRGKLLSDVYVVSALIEHHCYQDPAATKIFDRGMKLFPDDEQFALEYIKHLIKLNDVTNARAVFETVVNRLTQKPEAIPRTKPLFSFFHDYESQYGDINQIVKLEKRMNDLFPEDPQLARFAKRFSTPTFDPTVVRPIISLKAQMKPILLNVAPAVVPSVEEPVAPQPPMPVTRPSPTYSPRMPPASIPVTHSPKRPFEDMDNELAQPRKIIRGESPLKGAAGRRLDAARRNLARASENMAHMPAAPLPPPLPRELTFLLSIIPGAKHYDLVHFNPQKLVAVFQGLQLPPSMPPQNSTPVPPVQQHPGNPWGPPPTGGMGGYYGR